VIRSGSGTIISDQETDPNSPKKVPDPDLQHLIIVKLKEKGGRHDVPGSQVFHELQVLPRVGVGAQYAESLVLAQQQVESSDLDSFYSSQATDVYSRNGTDYGGHQSM